LPRHLALLSLVLPAIGCDAIDSVTDGFKHTQAVATELEQAAGARPFVAFNWHNGSLTDVTITFDGVPAGPPLAELVVLARSSVRSHFKQTPERVTVAFSVPGEMAGAGPAGGLGRPE
jgi:hypothetical protein